MRHVILLVSLLLGGCVMQRTTVLEQTVIHTERETTIKEDHQTTTTNHPAVPPKVIVNTVQAPPVMPEQKVKVADKPCGVFVLPNAGVLPPKPDLSVADDVDKAMSDYVKALRRHIEGERKSMVQAYDEHLKKCVP